MQVRDQILRTGGNVPRGDINKEYFAQNAEAQVPDPRRVHVRAFLLRPALTRGHHVGWNAAGCARPQMANGILPVDYNKGSLSAHEELEKLARRGPHYKRNLPHVCSFFVKGFCSRGDECPYRYSTARRAATCVLACTH